MKQFFTFALIFLTFGLFAQDKHFTQFYAIPLNLNPALTGAMGGKYRANVIYRNQWQTVSPTPYKTISGSFDIKLPIGLKKADEIGAGMLFYSDKTGTSNFNSNQIALSFAYHKALGLNKTQYLSIGYQMGIAQRAINYENLTFNDQFNGVSGYTIGTGEQLPENSFSFADLSTGLYFSSKPGDRQSFQIGLGFYHVNLPDVSFDKETIDRISPKMSMHLSGQFPVSHQIDMIPRLLVYYQSPHLETNVGANLKFILSDYTGASFYLGAWVRPVLDVKSSFGVDAIVLLTALEIQSVRIGLSFDANISSLIRSSKAFGAFEISLSYTGQDENSGVTCPTF